MNGTILVVEDEVSIRNIIRTYLEQEGFRVICTANGAETLAMVRQHRPDLIVLDLNLPGMDGMFADPTEPYSHMYHEMRRLRRLVNDLQSLSKAEAGQLSLHPEVFDLIALIKRVVSQLQIQTLTQGLTVIAAYPEKTLIVYADPDRTTQILLNLIGNAIRYTPEGGRITIQYAAKDRFAAVTVQDTGIGIPAEALPYIFERFYRVDSSRARSSGGSGSGLTISRHLTWAMGGQLTATSEGPDRGSTFILTLPLA